MMVEFYESHMHKIEENLCKYTSDKILQKVQWSKNYHNRCIDRQKKINDIDLAKYLIN